MEFLRQNLYDTTTAVKVNSNTDAAQYLFDNGTRLGYASAGLGADGQTVTISIEFSTPTVISHILIRKHNWKNVQVFYDSNAAQLFYANVANSEDDTYIEVASTTVSSVCFNITSTQTPDQEKSVGEIWVTERDALFERNPSANDYDPVSSRKQILHEMPDGGTVAYNIKEKFQAKLKWAFADDAHRDALLTVYQRAKPFIFVPSPTPVNWDGVCYEVVWTGKWDWTYSSNVRAGGWSGTIALAETPGG